MKEVIIVGSGINGLVAANYLVKHGFNVSVIEKSQNFINKVNQTGFKADLSGVGFEKTFGNKDQGLSATVYGQQDFGKPAQYGAKLGFNYKF